MMLKADNHWQFRATIEFSEDVGSIDGVLGDLRELCCVQFPGFMENLPGDLDFPDIVQQCRQSNLPHLVFLDTDTYGLRQNHRADIQGMGHGIVVVILKSRKSRNEEVVLMEPFHHIVDDVPPILN